MAELRDEVRWPLLGDFVALADPSAPGYPASEFLTEISAKYARSMDFRFQRNPPNSLLESWVCMSIAQGC